LSERTWVCPECHSVLDRDLNASINIYRKGVSDLGSDSKTPIGFPLGAVALATQKSRRL
jgi:transposase